LPSFRSGPLENRDHIDIPLVELASLARQWAMTQHVSKSSMKMRRRKSWRTWAMSFRRSDPHHYAD